MRRSAYRRALNASVAITPAHAEKGKKMLDYIKSLKKQGEEFSSAANCLSGGICTVDPTLSALEELLLNEVKQISYYLVKAKEFGFENESIAAQAIKALTITLVNTSFSEKEYSSVLESLIENKKEAKKIYLHICKNNPTSCEVVNFPDDINLGKKYSIARLIKEGEKYLALRAKGISTEKNGLLKLIILLTRTSAENIQRIKAFEPDYTKHDFEILRFFSLKNFPSTRTDKLKRRILEFAEIALDIRKKLTAVIEDRYGQKTNAKVLLSAKAGKSILVSGSNLKELEDLLIAAADKDVNIYTHDNLLVAHSYPKFREYKNLVGHWASENTLHDFANFKGVVYLTKTSYQKIDNLYRGLIYASDEIGTRGIGKITNGNYEPLIQSALRHEGFEEDEPEKIGHFEYNKEKVEQVLETKKDIIVFVGNSENVDFTDLVGNKAIINLQYPIEADLLIPIVEKVIKSKIDVTIFFTRCERLIVSYLLCLVRAGIDKIYFSKCPISIMNPYIIDTLSANFDIQVVQ